MPLSSNLFIKVFIAFWLATVTILGSWLLATDYFESQPPRLETSNRKSPGAPHRFMLRMIYNLENINESKLAKLVDNARKQHNIQIYLITPAGVDLLGKTVPIAVEKISRQLIANKRKAFVNSPREHLAAHRIQRPEEDNVSAVFMFPKKPGVILNTLSDSLWLRIALAVVISGLVCFGLSKLMTNRLKELQFASRRLANGELDTRLKVREKGGDETDELARDFNSMAKQLQERMQAQKRMRGEASHELRSPLARLRLSLVLAQEKPDNRLEYMQRIEQETERLEELIDQLLSSQAQEIHFDEHVDLVTLLEQLCTDANFEGQEQGKQFKFNSDTQEAIVGSFSDLLRRAFENIIRNALFHTAENSFVRVSLTLNDGTYRISIEDSGPGIPEQDLDKIFDEFYRIDTARTRESGGFGLGLAIARRALRQHGGTISAQNTGSGLNISVRLPAHPQIS